LLKARDYNLSKTIEDIRQQKKEEYSEEDVKREKEKQKQLLMKPAARRILKAFQMANPDLEDEVEDLILSIYNRKQLEGKITEDEMKQILKTVKNEVSNDYDIKRRF
jgi:programmed cell death protein 5